MRVAEQSMPPVATVPAEPQPGSQVAYVSLLCFVVILMLAPQSFFPVLAKLRPAVLAGGLAIGGHLLASLTGRRPILVPAAETGWVGALLGWAVCTVPLSMWPGGSADLIMGLYLKSVVVFVLIAAILDSPRRLTGLATTLTLISVPLSVSALHNYLSGVFMAGGSPAVRRITGYAAPLTENPNDLALTLNLILPLTVTLLVMAPRPGTRLALAAVVALQVVAIITTFSRAGFLTLALFAGVYLTRLWRGGQRQVVVMAVVCVALAFPLAAPNYVHHLGTITNIEADPTGSAQQRFSDMLTATHIVARHPLFGVGAGMNILALNEARGELWLGVHDIYLELAADLGLPGLTFFLLLLVRALRSAAAASKAARGELAKIAGGVRLSLIAFAVAGVFHPSAYHFYFYLIAGMAVAARLVHQRLQLAPSASI